MADLSIEKQYPEKIIVGIDEAGRGSWAGPLVVGAVIINQSKDVDYIKDSKQISKVKREKFSYQILKDHDSGIGIASVQEIIELGINNATFLAIDRATKKLSQAPDIALIDGNYKCIIDIKNYQNIIKGDNISVSIAAASIIAKVHRDNYMAKLSQEVTLYDWQNNVGYGTKSHMELLKKHGVSPHHRSNYKPIQKLLAENI